MSFQRMITATCDPGRENGYPDTCDDMAPASGWTIAEAWELARDAEWHRNGNRTICPNCWERGER